MGVKIVSWNVNGLRSVLQKGFVDYVTTEQPDVLCLQEIKINEVVDIGIEYHKFWSFADKKGYSGVAIFSKQKPLRVIEGFPGHNGDGMKEGRVLTAFFETFVVVSVYTPNAKRKLERLEYRVGWDADFLAYVQTLAKQHTVYVCGDLNVAHKEIDLARPKQNTRNAGFTDEERAGMDAFISAGFVDTFRYKYPDVTDVYSWWTYMHNARANNVGWRIDYVLASTTKGLQDAFIRTDVMGSDHCPVGVVVTV